MAMIFTDATELDHAILFANDSFLKLLGYQRHEVIGRPFGFLLPRTADSASLVLIQAQFECGTETIDIECQRKDGGRLWVAACVNEVVDGAGNRVQHFVSFVDLSERMKRMRTERDALHALYQHTPDFIAITEGPDHRFTFANAAYRQLVGQRDLIGLTLAEAMPELVGQEISLERTRAYETGERFVAAKMAIRLQREPGADLELRFVKFVYQPMRGPDGSVAGLFCEGHDVTAEKRDSEKVRHLQADLIHLSRVSGMGTMAATLAHELAQPLTAISNYVAYCRHQNEAEGDTTAELAKALAAIGEAAARGGEIIRRLKDITRRRKSQEELFDLKTAIRESIGIVRTSANADIVIEDRSEAGVTIEADRVQIQQVVMNLLRNACEAIGDAGGRVTVSTEAKEGRILISVADSGPGVAPETEKSLFAWTESTKPEGMGLGLSICRTIVEGHEGELWLERNGSSGACFTFALPAHAGAPLAAPAKEKPEGRRTQRPPAVPRNRIDLN